jgi:Asp-tRNA(Asn)/Glu-tRNA(Gln) amidotransferase A subunit family amidase
MPLDRRRFLESCSALGLTGLFPGALYAHVNDASADASPAAQETPITVEHVAAAEEIAGLSFNAEERELIAEGLNEKLQQVEALREVDLPNAVVPASTFDPRIGGASIPTDDTPMRWTPQPIERPSNDEDLAFMTVAELAYLLSTQQVTSMELTELYLNRLRTYDPVLKAVITYTEDRARRQAEQADAEIAAGNWRGPLHGIPWGAKDLLAVDGYKTTWGAAPYQDQILDETAAVVQMLDAAGAVLIAKLTLGALAWGDVWYGGTTKNPWNVEQGSSGSSAGPGSAVAAGCVGFAIGSETLGSIVSPSTRNGVTGHRPTYGAVPRTGAMALSWTMDKLGPMTRSAEDCALVFDAIRGADAGDPASVDMPFPYQQGFDVTDLRVGYLPDAFDGDYDNAEADQAVLDVLRNDLGLTLQPMALPTDMPIAAILNTLDVEAAAAFDELTRTRGIDAMVRQGENTWPNVFRTARFIPAVEHLQMSRARTVLMQRMHDVMQDVDAFVSPSYRGGTLRITNLTGHPAVCVPNAFHPLDDAPDSPRRQPASITFAGPLYQDHHVIALAEAYQGVTDFHRRRPPIQ